MASLEVYSYAGELRRARLLRAAAYRSGIRAVKPADALEGVFGE